MAEILGRENRIHEKADASLERTPVRPSIVVVTVAYNSSNSLLGHLRAVEGCLGGFDARHIVVDNSNETASRRIVEEESTRTSIGELTYLGEQSNPGFGAGMNLGIRKSFPGDYLFLCNPDSYPVAGSDLVGFAHELTETLHAAVGFPRVLNMDGSEPHERRHLPNPLSYPLWSLSTVLPKFGRGRRKTSEYVVVRSGSGASMLLRPGLIDQIGLMDETFFLYMEDTDFFKRVLDHGFRMIRGQSFVVRHVGGESSSMYGKSAIHRQAMIARGIYFDKHYGRRGLAAYLCWMLPESVAVSVIRAVKYRRIGVLREIPEMAGLAWKMWTLGPVNVQDTIVRPLFGSTPSSSRRSGLFRRTG